MVSLLIEKGIQLNLTDNLGRTALHICAEKSLSKLALHLLQAGIDASIRDRNGRTALEIARGKGDAGTIAALSR